MTKQKLTLFLFLLLCSCIVFAQERMIKGKITDENSKAPVVGATVSIKSARRAVITNEDGVFSITAPAGDVTLIISSIGYSTKVIVAKSSSETIDAELSSDTKQLGEVVVTALGITRQVKTLVYATQSVKVSELTGVRDPNNILNSFQGKVANAVITQGSGGPGSGARIVLRGNKSIGGDNNALIVVDGVPINNSTNGGSAGSDFGSVQGSDGASNINPDDIESVNILRGASAAALYGSQAGNGVIVITTKKGSKDRATVSVNSGIAGESAWALPKVQNTYGQGNNNSFVDSLFGDSWGPKMTGQTWTDYLGKSTTYSAQPNNIKNFFRTANSFNNSISASGGTEKTQAYLSYTNNHVEGIIPKNYMDRHTFTLRLSNQINKVFSTDAKVTYIKQDIYNKPRTGEENAPTIDIYQIPRNVSLQEAQQYQKISNVGVPAPTSYPSTLSSIYQDPYWMINNTALNESRDRIMGFVSAKFQITDWLKVSGRANLDKSFDLTKQQYQQGTLLWAGKAGGYFSQTTSTTTQKWFDVIFDGSNKLSNNLKLDYHAGAIYQDNQYNGVSDYADGLNVTNKFSLNYATNPASFASGTEVQTQSVFGQANFSFKEALFLEASLRNDWSSTLPPPHSFQYYSVGASAILTDLFTLPTAISYLKVNINYAEVGNGGGFGLLIPSFTYSQGAGNGFLSRSTTLPIPGLKPQIVRSTEAGVEAKFLNNRYGISATVYKSNSFNQLLLIPVPTATGYSNQYINAGNIQNKGLEIVISATPIASKDFNWDIAFNFALNRNKVIKMADNLKVVYFGGSDARSATPQVKEGGSYGDLVAFQWAKNAKGQNLVDSAGAPITTDKLNLPQGYIGNFNPRENLGLTNTFRYKRFNLRVLVDGRIGGVMVDGTEMNLAFSGIPEVTSKFREGGLNLGGVDASGKAVTSSINSQQFWQKASGKRYGVGEFFAYDATSFRFRELSFGYDIPVQSLKFIKSARLSAVARNLFWLYRGSSSSNIPGIGKRKFTFDPDMSLGNGNYQGISYGTLPATRTYGLNLQLTF